MSGVQSARVWAVRGALCAGALAATLALGALVGLGVPEIQTHTAGILVLCAAGLVCCALGHPRAGAILGGLAVLGGLFSLVEPRVSGSRELSASPLSVVVGCAVILLTGRLPLGQTRLVSALLGCTAGATGLVVLTARVAESSVFLWPLRLGLGGPGAALCFVVLGAGIVALAWRFESEAGRVRPMWAASVVGLSLLTVVVLEWQGMLASSRARIAGTVESVAAVVRGEIARRMDSEALALTRLVRRWESGWRVSREERRSEALAYVSVRPDHDTFHEALAWVGPSFRVSWVVSGWRRGSAVNSGQAKLLEGLAGVATEWRHALERARDGRRAALLRSRGLVAGGEKLLFFVPVFPNSQFAGFLVGIVGARAFLEAAAAGVLAAGYELVVADGEGEIYRSSSAEWRYPKEWKRETGLIRYGERWQVRVWPRRNPVFVAGSVLPMAIGIGGLLTALLLSVAVYVAQKARLQQVATAAANSELQREISHRKRVEVALSDLTSTLEEKVRERSGTAERRAQELSRVTEELRTSEQRLSLALWGAGQVLWDWDVTSGEIYVSDEWCRMMGCLRCQAPRTLATWREWIHPEDAQRVSEVLKAHLKGETACFDVDLRMAHRQRGWTWFRARGKVVERARDGRALRVTGTHTDISDLKEAERERERMEVRLRQAQKLEAIGQLAAGIAHEINTPAQYVGDNTRFLQEAFEDLRRVLSSHGRLLEGVKREGVVRGLVAEVESEVEGVDVGYLLEEVPRAIEQSLEGVERVTRIVGAMKEFSHPGGGERKLVDLNRAIESTVTVARNEWKYVAEMEMDLDPGLPRVWCLPGEVNQVILNLVVNAAQAIGEVVGRGTGRRGRIRVSTRAEGGWVEVRVEDSGGGIPEGIRDRIFDPFFTTKEVGRGTGQGLAIAHDVVVGRHGGTITFETEEGRGTTFIVRLPVGDGAEAQSQARV